METQERVLITGATGILGANTAAELSKRGYLVTCLSRQAEKPSILEGIDCKMLLFDPEKPDLLLKHIKQCDYIIHAAAKTGQTANSMNDFLSFNVGFTKKLVDMSKQAGIKRFIFISTANCFTNGSLEIPGTESSEFMPWLKNSGYAWSKYQAQSYVLEEAEKNAFPAMVLAPTFVIGRRDNGKSSGQLVKHGRKKIIFHPPGGKSFIDAELAAKAIANSLQSGRIGEIYMISGQNLSYGEFFRKMAKAEGKKKIYIQVPLFILKATAWTLDFLNRTLHTRFALDKINQRLLCLGNYFDNSKAKKELGLRDTNIENIFK